MVQSISEINLKSDLEKILVLPEADRWKIEHPADLEVLVTLSSVRSSSELFQARLYWDVYPDNPPSLKFRDPSSGRLDMPTAWPVVRGFRPQSLDACVNWTAEGFRLHPEWSKDPQIRWDSQGNVLLKIIRIMQSEMDEDFHGRFKQ